MGKVKKNPKKRSFSKRMTFAVQDRLQKLIKKILILSCVQAI